MDRRAVLAATLPVRSSDARGLLQADSVVLPDGKRDASKGVEIHIRRQIDRCSASRLERRLRLSCPRHFGRPAGLGVGSVDDTKRNRGRHRFNGQCLDFLSRIGSCRIGLCRSVGRLVCACCRAARRWGAGRNGVGGFGGSPGCLFDSRATGPSSVGVGGSLVAAAPCIFLFHCGAGPTVGAPRQLRETSWPTASNAALHPWRSQVTALPSAARWTGRAAVSRRDVTMFVHSSIHRFAGLLKVRARAREPRFVSLHPDAQVALRSEARPDLQPEAYPNL